MPINSDSPNPGILDVLAVMLLASMTAQTIMGVSPSLVDFIILFLVILWGAIRLYFVVLDWWKSRERRKDNG